MLIEKSLTVIVKPQWLLSIWFYQTWHVNHLAMALPVGVPMGANFQVLCLKNHFINFVLLLAPSGLTSYIHVNSQPCRQICEWRGRSRLIDVPLYFCQ